MQRITKSLGVSTLLVLGGAFSPLAAQATHATRQTASYRRDLPAALTKEAAVPESAAAKTAEARVRHGRIQGVELENEKGRLIYSYDLKAPGKSGVEEVNVDAKTGKVVSAEHESAKAEKKEAAQEQKESAHAKPATHMKAATHTMQHTMAPAKKPTR